MKRNRKIYNAVNLASAVFMILALLWLTVSIPFVAAAKDQLTKQDSNKNISCPHSTNEEEANPLGNTTEEKAPSSGSSVSEEYLHDNHLFDSFISVASQKYKCENSGTYDAFHGEVHVPPPNIA